MPPLTNRPLTAEEQLKVLSRIWGNDRDGYCFMPWIDGSARDGAARRKNYHEGRAFRWPRERGAILEHLKSHETDDLYFAPSLFNGKRRIEEQAEAERALWADLDPVNPRGLGNRRPTIAWESSPGRYQGVWLLSTMRQGASWAGKENHRLTVEIGADPSGWDTTQLLRVPGRPNFKPDYRNADGSPAPGKLLWLDGPRYTWSDFDDLPEVGKVGNGADDVDLLDEGLISGVDRHAVWARVRLRVSKPVREYMGARTAEGADRSDILWQIERDLADAGCSLAEIVAVVRHTVWNKYAGRNDELKRLKIEAAKALAEVANGDGEVLEGITEKKPGIQWLTQVVAEGIPRPRWLVREVWAKGACGFISGAPKSYKSWIGLDLAVTIATGTNFLNDSSHPMVGGPKPVLMLLEEDDKRLVLSRLAQILEAKDPEAFWHGQLSVDASGAVVWRGPNRELPLALHIGHGFIASDEGWQAWLDEMMGEGKFSFVVIDTLGTTAGDIDTDRANEVMSKMLRPLKILSQKHDCAIGIVHHNKKGDGTARAGQDMLGSVALHAWVENALYVRKKELSTRGETTAFVERESKQASDWQFRVKVPLMRINPDDTRTLWAPELLPGWGHTDEATEPQVDDTRASQAASGASRRRGGRPQFVFEMGQGGGKTRFIPLERIAQQQDASVSSMKKRCDQAVKDGWLIEKNGGYKLTEKATR